MVSIKALVSNVTLGTTQRARATIAIDNNAITIFLNY